MTLASVLSLTLSTANMALPVEINLPSSDIRLGELVHSAELGDLLLGQVPKGKAMLLLTADEQLRLIRNRLPRQATSLKFPAGVLIHVQTTKANMPRLGNACYQTRTALPAGSYLGRSDAIAVQCSTTLETAKLRFDRDARASFTEVDLPAFSYLGSVMLAEIAPVPAGSKMTLRTVSGPVTIDQSVVTLTPGRAGKRIFVQTDDGMVISEQLSSADIAGRSK